MKIFTTLLTILFIVSCSENQNTITKENPVSSSPKIDKKMRVDGFDFPVGKPNGEGYYDAQNFGINRHLGEDWNGKDGGDTDLGDTIYAIANGKISFAEDLKGGWGKVIRIVHQLPEEKQIESLYAHCDQILVNENSYVKKGDPIGTIGTADGKYLAHLHFEIRSEVGMPIGQGYSANSGGYLNPTKFIQENREILWEK